MHTYIKLFTILLLATNGKASAQKIIFSEDFNKFQNTITGWNNSTHTGPNGWQAAENYLVTGNVVSDCLCYNANNAVSYRKVAGISDCNRFHIDHNNSNVLMFTPAINLTGHSKVILKMDSYFKQKTDGVHTEKGTVEISTNQGSSWTVLGNVLANPNLTEFTTYYFDISVYNIYSDVRIGFRYSDNGGFLTGWAVDDVMVFEPVNKDISLVSVTPDDNMLSYTAINTGIQHEFKVFNAGVDTIRELVLGYMQENKSTRTDTIRNISLPSFATGTFKHHIADTVTIADKTKVTTWVYAADDTMHTNDTLLTAVNGAWFMPQKIVALEEGTGTWNGYCVPGHVYMQQLAIPGYYACQVAVHDNDPMMTATIKDYNDFLFNVGQNYTPYFLLDRRFAADGTTLLEEVKRRQQYFGYADIHIDPKIEGNLFKVGIDVVPAVDMQGDYRLELVITEDDVTGNGGTWDQANAYAGGGLGPMGGFESKPDPVPAKDMKYQFVARTILPSAAGVTNLPSSMTHQKSYHVQFDAALDPSWNKNKLRANIFLLRQADSTIINSNKVLFYLGIDEKAELLSEALLYPNPATDRATLQFMLTEPTDISINITDISGRILINNTARQYAAGKNETSFVTTQLAPGIYLVNLISDKGRKTIKMQVAH